MSDYPRWNVAHHLDWFRRQFAQHGKLPFANVLPEETVIECLRTLGVVYYESLYNPVAVVWLFLSQVIHANPTLAVVVENFLAWRLGQGLSPCSVDTGAYTRARQRLPESLLALLTQQTGREADRAAPDGWRWLGRVVKLFDGSTVSMPDTPENQAAYPQNRSQAPGVGFPIARIGVLFSLTVGTVLDVGLRRWAGKFQSELAILRDMFSMFDSGDVLLTDRYLCSYMEITVLHSRGVDFVGRIHASRKVDFRSGQRLGPGDHLARWIKPRRPEWMSPKQYAALPDSMCLRELRQQIVRKGYRTRTIVIVTTLLDAELFPRDEIAKLYRLRWDAEINLRSLKTMMQMDVLRCKTPEMVRKEIWAHLLAYNLIRTVMAQAALAHGKHPRHLSFTRAMRTLEAFRPTLAHTDCKHLPTLYEYLLRAIAAHEIGNRSNRLEPRQRKRRPKPYKLMTQPRNEARKQYTKQR
ncbi:MAG: IS4 family transposase [Planctomycetes bacterium]|nr:IS4 family transposase [Planctomycetota bacterium]